MHVLNLFVGIQTISQPTPKILLWRLMTEAPNVRGHG